VVVSRHWKCPNFKDLSEIYRGCGGSVNQARAKDRTRRSRTPAGGDRISLAAGFRRHLPSALAKIGRTYVVGWS
jgi:hypothetical protein